MGTVYRAGWVLPIARPPIQDGWVDVEHGRILRVGDAGERPPGAVHEVDGAILPGLVNAHTHLELSYLHERIPPSPSFGDWVRIVMEMRRRYPDPADPAIIAPAREAIALAVAAGTALFGEVSNTLVTVPLLRERAMPAQVFHELTGFTEQEPEARVREARARADAAASEVIRVSVAPHAPYSVSSRLFEALAADLEAHPTALSSVHLGETPEEVELLRHGTGAIRQVLEALGRWPAAWRPPGVGPVEYLDSLGVLHPRMLAVHGVQFDRADLMRLRARGGPLVSCPRSNVHVGVGSPPLALFYEMGVGVAFGTDSLASVADLNLFAELHAARRLAPGVAARRLLESATRIGAKALGFDDLFGTIEPGRRADLLVAATPPDVDDVEEYLVSGITPAQITWLTRTGM